MKIAKTQNKLFGKTPVSDVFICEYLPGLPPLAVKLYLYLLYASENQVECTEDSLAMILSSESSVVKENLIVLESAGLILWQNETILVNDLIQKEVERNYRLRTVARPDDLAIDGREKNLARSKIQKAISDKFFSGQMPVSWYNEIELWFEKYDFEPDVVFMLFQHCANSHVMTKPYIRKVADTWGGRFHIHTAEQLESYLNAYESYKILRNEVAKRLKWHRNFNVYEEEIVEKWFYTYQYDIEIVDIALRKSVGKNNATLATFDAIITSWYKSGLKTKAEIMQFEDDRKKAYQAAQKNGATPAAKTKVEQKENFTQRSYDEDFLNSLYMNEDEQL